jgi:hypothetical protein
MIHVYLPEAKLTREQKSRVLRAGLRRLSL